MAIQIDYDTGKGIIITNAYIRIRTISIINGEKIEIIIDYYADKINRDEGKTTNVIDTEAYKLIKEEDEINYNAVVEAEDSIAAVYTYLKTLEEFEGSEDIFEEE